MKFLLTKWYKVNTCSHLHQVQNQFETITPRSKILYLQDKAAENHGKPLSYQHTACLLQQPVENPEEPLSYQHIPAITHKPKVNIESQRSERLEGQQAMGDREQHALPHPSTNRQKGGMKREERTSGQYFYVYLAQQQSLFIFISLPITSLLMKLSLLQNNDVHTTK